MELLQRLEIEDIELLAGVFFARLSDELGQPPENIRRAVNVFREVLKEGLFEDTEMLENLRLGGNPGTWE